jgi:PAS domain S-box-containing protein
MSASLRFLMYGVTKIFLTLLTEPHKTITSPQARRASRLAASLFALTVTFLVIHVALFSLTNRHAPQAELLLVVAMAIVQYLCRTRWSKFAIPIGLYLTFATAPFLMVLRPQIDGLSLQLLLTYPIIGVLLTYRIYGGLYAVLVTFASVIGMGVAITASGMSLPSTGILVGYVAQSITVALILVFLQRYETTAGQQLDEPNREEQSVRLIIDNIADIVLMTDGDLVIQYVNLAATAILGYAADEFEGRSLLTVFDIMHDEDRDAIRAALQQVMTTQTSLRTEYRLRGKGGAYVWLETICNFLRKPDGAITGIIFTGRDISARKAAEALYASEQKIYETLVNSIDGIVWQGNTIGRVDFVSRQVKMVLGFEPEQLNGHVGQALSRIHPEDYERVLALKREKTARLEDHRLEYRMINAAGETIWVRDTIKFLVDETGSPKVLGLLVNITDLKEAQASEKQQRQFAEALSVSASEMTETVEQDEVLDRILRQARDIFSADCMNVAMIEDGVLHIVRSHGYERFGIAPKTDTQEIPLPSYLELHADIEQPGSGTMRRLRSHVSAPIRVNGETIGAINLDKIAENAFDEQTGERLQAFADQTSVALRNAQLYMQVKRYAEELEFLIAERTEALLKERRQLQAILNALTEGVAYTEGTMKPDESLTTVYVNPALVEMTGYQADDLMKTNLRILLPSAERDAHAVQNRVDALANIERNGIWRTEMRLVSSDGRAIDVDLITSRVDNSAGNLLGVVTVIRDISEEKALTQQRERFIAHASHELRTPVTNLLTRLYLARKRPLPFEPHLDLLDEIALRMKQLVDDLLDVSRMDRQLVALKREPLVIGEVLRSVVRLQQGEADKKHISLRLESDGSTTHLSADADRLTQVLTNLISNAINYTPEGGMVTVCLESHSVEKRVAITVADTGIGIPDEHLTQIFQPFFRVPNETNSVKGSGLGLAISKEIIELHGGTLTVESERGKGSRFIVRLPM